MLKKIIRIENVGKFRSCAAAGDVDFRKLTVIFAENGRGKTTLGDILRSLETGDANYIAGRRTLGSSDESKVHVRLDVGTAKFEGGAWDQTAPELSIYDTTFVHNNIYAGDRVEHSHKKNLYQVIVGEEGVRLAREIEDLDEESRSIQRGITASKKEVKAYAGALSVEAFVKLGREKEVDKRIAEHEDQLRALESLGEISRKPLLSSIEKLSLPSSSLAELLGKEVEGLSAEAEAAVRRHISEHVGLGGEPWLSQGLRFADAKVCPFCAQSLVDVDIVTTYRTFFSEAYGDLKSQITVLRSSVERYATDADIVRLESIVVSNGSLLDSWSKFVELEELSLPEIEGFSGAAKSVRSVVLARVDQKIQSPLEVVDLGDEYHRANERMAEIEKVVDAYNEVVERVNTAVASRRSELESTDLGMVRNEADRLKAAKKRWETVVEKACGAYSAAVERKKGVEEDKAEAREKLEKYTQSVFPKYEAELNSLLLKFGATFRIAGTGSQFSGGRPSWSYRVVINSVPVELGDDKTPIDKPAFRNTLSTGDRSTLGLAFFLVRLRESPNLGEKVVVFDDPFSSQDRSRRDCTKARILEMSREAKQVVLMSHDASFLRSVWEGAPKAQTRSLQLSRMGEDASVITEWSIEDETRPRYRKNHAVLRDYRDGVEDHAPQLVMKTIRPLIEEFLRNRFPGEFGETEWLGEFIKNIRSAEAGEVLAAAHEIVEEVGEINDYSKKYHHANDAVATDEEIDDGELRTFVERTLALVGGY